MLIEQGNTASLSDFSILSVTSETDSSLYYFLTATGEDTDENFYNVGIMLDLNKNKFTISNATAMEFPHLAVTTPVTYTCKGCRWGCALQVDKPGKRVLKVYCSAGCAKCEKTESVTLDL